MQEIGFKLSERDESRLNGVHPSLASVVRLAAEKYRGKFMVVEGTRTIEKQKENVAKGASKTMNSKHLPQGDEFSHAVDLAPLVNGTIPWNDKSKFKELADCMKDCATEMGVKIEWGGDWRSFYDGPHFQLG